MITPIKARDPASGGRAQGHGRHPELMVALGLELPDDDLTAAKAKLVGG